MGRTLSKADLEIMLSLAKSTPKNLLAKQVRQLMADYLENPCEQTEVHAVYICMMWLHKCTKSEIEKTLSDVDYISRMLDLKKDLSKS